MVSMFNDFYFSRKKTILFDERFHIVDGFTVLHNFVWFIFLIIDNLFSTFIHKMYNM